MILQSLICAALLGSQPAAAAGGTGAARKTSATADVEGYFAEQARALERSGETLDLFLGKNTTVGLGIAGRATAKVPREKEKGGFLRLLYDAGGDGKPAALLFTAIRSKPERVREYLIGLDGKLLRAAESGRPLGIEAAEVRRSFEREAAAYRTKTPL